MLKTHRDQLSKLSQDTDSLLRFDAFLATREDKKLPALAKEIATARAKRANDTNR